MGNVTTGSWLRNLMTVEYKRVYFMSLLLLKVLFAFVDNVVVEWFKIKNQNVESVRSLKCELLDIDKHASFNQLHEGKIVVRKEGIGGKGVLAEFRFGTIVRVKRFELGQVKKIIIKRSNMIE